MKPQYCAASVGVRICSNRQEMIDAVEEVLNSPGLYGHDLKELVIQERIIGQEYVVNTMSCDGVHRITTL